MRCRDQAQRLDHSLARTPTPSIGDEAIACREEAREPSVLPPEGTAATKINNTPTITSSVERTGTDSAAHQCRSWS